MLIRPICDGDENRVVDRWEACRLTRPWNSPRGDIALARRTPRAEIFVGIPNDEIFASVLCGNDGPRGWEYYLAMAPQHQNDGLGNKLMAHGENWLLDIGVPKSEIDDPPGECSSPRVLGKGLVHRRRPNCDVALDRRTRGWLA